MDALSQLVDRVAMLVIAHNPVRMIEDAAHVSSHRCSFYVLARQEFSETAKRGCLPPALRASPEDIFGKMKDELNCDKVML